MFSGKLNLDEAVPSVSFLLEVAIHSNRDKTLTVVFTAEDLVKAILLSAVNVKKTGTLNPH